MAVSNFYIRHQGPVLAGLARVAWAALVQKPDPSAGPPPTPGPGVQAVVPARPEALVSALVRWAGGDPKAWKGTIPPYMFPQWGFPVLGRTLDGVPYPLAKVLNQGCRFEVREPLVMGEALELNAHLHEVDDNGTRARIHQQLTTAVQGHEPGLVADVYAFVPLAKRKKGGKKREPPVVPLDAEELGRRKLSSGAGLDFARLTGDFNPVHWIGPYARMAGFRSTILHGFATAAIATEAVIAARWMGDAMRLHSLEVRFTRPLVLPARPGVFVSPPDEQGRIPIAVGMAPGGEAVMLGHIQARSA
jgi:acyl dehydratase